MSRPVVKGNRVIHAPDIPADDPVADLLVARGYEPAPPPEPEDPGWAPEWAPDVVIRGYLGSAGARWELGRGRNHT